MRRGGRLLPGLLAAVACAALSACAAPPAETAPPSAAPETPAPIAETAPIASETPEIVRCVVIDPGHQRYGSAEQEPIGPGAAETKARVTGGTTGRYSGIPEYELNLQLGLQLRAILEARGYRVVMTRTDNDVDLSNAERAALAAEAGGDVLVRIHANGSDDPAANGAMTICMTPESPYNSALYPQSYALALSILDALTARTGCRREPVWETDSMSGINWSTIPVTIVEVGYMTNEREDLLLATDAYREQAALGIADGIDQYFAALSEEAARGAAGQTGGGA